MLIVGRVASLSWICSAATIIIGHPIRLQNKSEQISDKFATRSPAPCTPNYCNSIHNLYIAVINLLWRPSGCLWIVVGRHLVARILRSWLTIGRGCTGVRSIRRRRVKALCVYCLVARSHCIATTSGCVLCVYVWRGGRGGGGGGGGGGVEL